VLSAVASKILAAQAGPAAIATLVTLQQVRQGALLAATVNGQTAVIQGASSRTARDRREYVRTAALLFLAGTLVVCGVCAGFPGAVRRGLGFGFGLGAGVDAGRGAGLGVVSGAAFRWIAASVLCSSALLFLTSLLNAMGRIKVLAQVQIVAPLMVALGMGPVVRAILRNPADEAAGWLAMLVAIATAMAAAAAAWPLLADWPRWREWVRGSGSWWSKRAARAFLSISAAMLVSGLIATAALLAVRGRIVAQQGWTAAGCFDAAWNISMNHASLLLASLQTYSLPVLARARTAREQSEHITAVLLLALPAAAVMIAAIAIAKPWVIELLYAPSFQPAAGLLRWTLVGDYLKIGSWILSLPLLARADMKAFLLLDTAAYAAFAGSSLVLWRVFSPAMTCAEGAALGFVCMYAVHLAGGAALLRWRCGIRLERCAVALWCGGFAFVALVSAFTWRRL
jgi:hypothetical protein